MYFHYFILNISCNWLDFGTVGSIDVLSATGLINYFGKWTDLTRVVIPPIVLKKRNTQIALYGLSYINDQRLSRLYRDEKVYFFKCILYLVLG